MDPVNLEVRNNSRKKIKIWQHDWDVYSQCHFIRKEKIVNVPVSGQQQHFRPFFDSRFTGHLLDFRLSDQKSIISPSTILTKHLLDDFPKEEV